MDYLCLLDECAISEEFPNPFLLYGAAAIPWDSVHELDERLTRIRNAAGYPNEFPLKWSWQGGLVSQGAHSQAKSELLKSLKDLDVKLFVSLVHRGIAAGVAADDQSIQYGANAVLRALDAFVIGSDGHGLVVLDRFGTAQGFADEKGTRGLLYPGKPDVPLSRFLSFSVGSAASSRISSVIDVALGAFGYCLNPQNRLSIPGVSGLVMPLVATDNKGNVGFFGVSFYPVTPYVPDHVEAYRRVTTMLSGYGLKGLQDFGPPSAQASPGTLS